jgi:hypothetical protein
LMPEVKRICKTMGFKGEVPTAEFVNVDIKDESIFARIYATLAQSGMLTPDEVIEAIKTGVLPSPEDSLESQKEFKKHKDAGLYEPVINQAKEENGRPSGSSGTKTPNRKTRVVGSEEEIKEVISIKAVTEVFKKANSVMNSIQQKYLKDNNKRKVTDEIQDTIFGIAKSLFYNESWKNWEEKWTEYYDAPKLPNSEKVTEITAVINEYDVSELLGVVLYNSLEKNYE